jgi:hypothetical protein
LKVGKHHLGSGGSAAPQGGEVQPHQKLRPSSAAAPPLFVLDLTNLTALVSGGAAEVSNFFICALCLE